MAPDYSRDYTQDISVAETLQQALDLSLGEGRLAPGGVLKARSVAQVRKVLAVAVEFGGQVTLGKPTKKQLGLDLSLLKTVRELDVQSGLCTVEAGATVSELEHALSDAGLSLERGHFGDPNMRIGEAVAAGEGAGLVVSVGAWLPDGTVFHTPVAPRRATGPNPDALLVGARHSLALVSWVTLRVSAKPARVEHAARSGPPDVMLEALRRLQRARRPRGAWMRVISAKTAVVTVEAADAPVEPLLAALVVPGSRKADPDLAPPPSSPPRRLTWSMCATRLRRGMWLGPTDLHGGWVRVPGGFAGADAHLEALKAQVDPFGTLAHQQPPRRRKGS